MEPRRFYAQTWQRVSLFVEPELLESIFSDCCVVILNHHRGKYFVEDHSAPYRMTAFYRHYVETLITTSRREWSDWKELYGPELTSSSSLLADGTPDRSVPAIVIQTEELYYNAYRKQLMTKVANTGELKFGIILSFPNTITYDFESILETAATPNGELFALLKKTIMSRTKPCKFRSPSGIHRSSIRISDGIHARLKSHPMLAAHQLEVI
ncbi:MAG: hypothetical protein QE269_12525 [Fimbriimonas sp.]|nr:hypothetical protein [Fimbriimonas sp.]